MNGAILWWRDRSVRERRLLLAMGALAAIVLGWLLLRPLDDAVADARARHAQAVIELAEVRGQAALVRAAAGSRAPRLNGSLDAVLARSAAEAGFSAPRIEALGPTRATVSLDAARPQALFGWVTGIEALGVGVERMEARINPDQSLAVTLTFRATGR